jgi:mannose/fructose/N-acetylgalactosamine-specific phosphotransferase system component IIC
VIDAQLLPLVLLGAVLGLDVVSFPQAQVSRPIVAATVAGAFAGSPLAGLMLGAVLELIALETLPVGASRYPEWGSASVVGGVLYASVERDSPGAMSICVLLTLVIAYLGGLSMVLLRKQNAAWARLRRERLEAGSRNTVVRLQVGGLTADLVRGAVITFFGLLAARPLVRFAVESWSIDGRLSRAVVVGTAAAVAAGAVWKLFHSAQHARWFMLGGVVAGLLLLAIR